MFTCAHGPSRGRDGRVALGKAGRVTLGKLLELMGTMGESPDALRDPKNIQVLAQ
jgi:hypothetical protein